MVWLEQLSTECAKRSQAQVAREMGVSPATVNQVLKGTYLGKTGRIETLVRSKYMHETVKCPVLGEIELGRCMEEQDKPFGGHNPIRVELFRACPNCPNNKKCKGK